VYQDVDYRKILQSRGWLALQPEPFRAKVFAGGRLVELQQGKSLYVQEDPPGGIFGIVRGALAVNIARGATGPHFCHLANPSEWFGEGPFLTGIGRMVGLEAPVDTLLFNLPLDAMERMAAEDPRNIRHFAQITLVNMAIAMRVVEDLLIPDPLRRVAAVLFRVTSENDNCVIPLSQVQIGSMANVSRKLVNRALKKFESRAWVRPGYCAVEVVDRDKLRQYADERRDL
jgi:CRP/FNR family cyclic AMP-dependent transcriptional regulator